MNKPIIGITIGDPCGVGPEIIIKALTFKKIYTKCKPLVIANKSIIDEALRVCDKEAKYGFKIKVIKNIEDAVFDYKTINIIDAVNFKISNVKYRKVIASAGKAAGQSIECAVQLALDGKINAITTAPINKESFALGGYKFPGHTEMLATLTDTKDYTMMLSSGNFRVVHLSTHVSLKRACEMVKKSVIYERILLANNICKQLGIKTPQIAVAGLNPHSGENGMFGKEEIEEITPAIKKQKNKT